MTVNNPVKPEELINELDAAGNEVGLKINLAELMVMYNDLIDVQN